MARAFVAFQMEDRWARDFLVQHAKDKNNDIGFTDYSVHEPFDEKWKTNCKERISKTKGTIVLVGPDTANAEAVVWEITETNRQEHPIFGVQIHRDETHAIPAVRAIALSDGTLMASSRSWNAGDRIDRSAPSVDDERDEMIGGDVAGEPTAEEFVAAADLPENYFELYKLAVKSAAYRLVEAANTFFLTINTGLVALMGGDDERRWYLPVAGLLFCVTWWALLKSYRDLNSAKFQIILGMEERLPVRVYADESRIYTGDPVIFQLRRKVITKWIAQYRELNRVERLVPVVFGAIYLAELARQLIG